ncbi:metallophosphoesterase [Bacillus spongiae]|uniref:Phosphoesterase n=1 Tax=Bacillus spongiae TaxID=2683610 RepID=A0ABU8H8U0_9BACI
MKVLVVSDSHGSRKALLDIQKHYGGELNAMFHCGDSELHENDDALKGFQVVKGNCDWNGQFPEEIVQQVGSDVFFITHGHLYNVKMTLMNVSYKAREHNATIVLFGHSHIVGAELIHGMLFINPGSIALPRNRKEKTYCLIERKEKMVIVSFFDENHDELIDLRQEFFI